MNLKYNLHDSLIEELNYNKDENRLEIKIELCNWKQIEYKDTEPELVDIRIVFDDIQQYEISVSNFIFDSNEILDVLNIDKNTIKIVFMAENDAETIIISAKNIYYVD